jgi:hypothetical protein
MGVPAVQWDRAEGDVITVKSGVRRELAEPNVAVRTPVEIRIIEQVDGSDRRSAPILVPHDAAEQLNEREQANEPARHESRTERFVRGKFAWSDDARLKNSDLVLCPDRPALITSKGSAALDPFWGGQGALPQAATSKTCVNGGIRGKIDHDHSWQCVSHILGVHIAERRHSRNIPVQIADYNYSV